MSSATPDDVLRIVQLAIGIVGLFLIPGYYITCLIQNIGSSICNSIDKMTLSFVLGFGLQILNVLILYSSISLFYIFDFKLAILSMTFLECTGIGLVNAYRGIRSTSQLAENGNRSLKWLPAILFVSALALRLFYQQFIIGFTTDGGLYLDQARALASTGRFTSHVVNDGNADPYASQLGFNSHPGTYFAIAIFFSICGVSLSSAKFMTTFSGALIVVLVYWLAHYLFRKEAVAVFASILAMFHPTLIVMSSLVQGPEVLSAVFILTALISLLTYVERREVSIIVLSGILLFLAGICWSQDFYIFFAFVPFIVFLSSTFCKKGRLRTGLYESILWTLCGIYVVMSVRLNMYPSIYLLLIVSLVALTLLSRKLWRGSWKTASDILLFPSVVLVLFTIYYIRSYAYPQVGVLVAPSFDERLPTVLPSLSWLLPSILASYLGFLNLYVGEVFICLALLSLLLINATRQLSIPLAIVAIYVLTSVYSYPLFQYEDQFRYFLIPIISIIIITGFFLWFLARGTVEAVKRIVSSFKVGGKKSRNPTVVAYIAVFSVAVLMVAPSFATSYASNISIANDALYTKINAEWTDEMINWISSSSPGSEFLCRKPWELAWLTSVNTVNVVRYGQPMYALTLENVTDIIREFKVNYLIVDRVLIDSCPKLKPLYSNQTVPGFDLVFESLVEGKNVFIYNVTSLQDCV